MKRILIVDDAIFMRIMLKTIIEKGGYEVAGEAQNGLEAILKYKELKPDLVTMDITMPEMDGINSMCQIKNFDPNCKIIVISALGCEDMVREAFVAGAKGFIVKPFKEDNVIETIRKFLG